MLQSAVIMLHASLRARKLKLHAAVEGACWLMLAPATVLPTTVDTMTELPPPAELIVVLPVSVLLIVVLSTALELMTVLLAGLLGTGRCRWTPVLIILEPVRPLPKLPPCVPNTPRAPLGQQPPLARDGANSCGPPPGP